MIVSQFRKSVTCFPATKAQRSIANIVDRLTYIDEMVDGKLDNFGAASLSLKFVVFA